MPVVDVEDPGLAAQALEGLDGRADEEREAPEAVVLTPLVRRVDRRAVKERIVGDEVDRNGRSRQKVPEEAHAVGATEDPDVEGRERLLGPRAAPAVPVGRLEVKREEDVDVVSARGKGFRERAHDVPEAARLRERDALGGEVRDSQRGLSSRSRWPRACARTSRRR